ncbi:unnamed protein product [Gongylonema pulchrum]|uniref:Anaphase-promoting complex subunit 1 n=1 Tax=Gongylonema pulchrum TaxID=637853 RepID=A0A183EHY2_9BILA|nr:unnamed protein product [Gongylonema pulchrum]
MYYTMMVMPLERNNQGLKRLRHAAEAATMFNVLCTLLMAGSGNLQVLRICRLLRTRVTIPDSHRDNVNYSIYAAAHATVGMLMMGYGRYAFKTDDLSIAALVIAFFPISPHRISDNRQVIFEVILFYERFYIQVIVSVRNWPSS